MPLLRVLSAPARLLTAGEVGCVRVQSTDRYGNVRSAGGDLVRAWIVEHTNVREPLLTPGPGPGTLPLAPGLSAVGGPSGALSLRASHAAAAGDTVRARGPSAEAGSGHGVGHHPSDSPGGAADPPRGPMAISGRATPSPPASPTPVPAATIPAPLVLDERSGAYSVRFTCPVTVPGCNAANPTCVRQVELHVHINGQRVGASPLAFTVLAGRPSAQHSALELCYGHEAAANVGWARPACEGEAEVAGRTEASARCARERAASTWCGRGMADSVRGPAGSFSALDPSQCHVGMPSRVVEVSAGTSLRLRLRLGDGLGNWCAPGPADAAAVDLRLRPAADLAGAGGIPVRPVSAEAEVCCSSNERIAEAQAAAEVARDTSTAPPAGTKCAADGASAQREPSTAGASDGAASAAASPATPIIRFPDSLGSPCLGPLRAGWYYAWATFNGQHVSGSPMTVRVLPAVERAWRSGVRQDALSPSGIVAQATDAVACGGGQAGSDTVGATSDRGSAGEAGGHPDSTPRDVSHPLQPMLAPPEDCHGQVSPGSVHIPGSPFQLAQRAPLGADGGAVPVGPSPRVSRDGHTSGRGAPASPPPASFPSGCGSGDPAYFSCQAGCRSSPGPSLDQGACSSSVAWGTSPPCQAPGRVVTPPTARAAATRPCPSRFAAGRGYPPASPSRHAQLCSQRGVHPASGGSQAAANTRAGCNGGSAPSPCARGRSYSAASTVPVRGSAGCDRRPSACGVAACGVAGEGEVCEGRPEGEGSSRQQEERSWPCAYAATCLLLGATTRAASRGAVSRFVLLAHDRVGRRLSQGGETVGAELILPTFASTPRQATTPACLAQAPLSPSSLPPLATTTDAATCPMTSSPVVVAPCHVVDCEDGTYLISAAVPADATPGEASLHVWLADTTGHAHVGGSPFPVLIGAATAPV